MNLNPKKKCLYIKNKYIFKNTKLNNTINPNFENKKLISDYNVNKKDSATISKQFSKKSVKPVYQNIYSQKAKHSLKGNQNFLSTKNIHIKSPRKEIIEDPNLFATYVESISGRKSGNKKYEISNPFKERSNSENSLNIFNRTYTSFNNKENNKDTKNNNILKDNNKKNIIENKNNNSSMNISSKNNNINNNELKINLSSINFNKNIYNIKNNIKQNKKCYNNYINYAESSYIKKNGTSTAITRKNSKKYLYKEQSLKKISQINNNPKILSPYIEKENQKETINSVETIFTQINLLSPTVPANDNGLPENNNNNKNSKRIQKYILSDKKRKTKSRQNYRDYKYKEGKSKSLCPEPKKHVNTPKRNNIFENKFIKHKSNLVRYGENGKLLKAKNDKNINKENEDKLYYNNGQVVPKYYYEKDSTSIDGFSDINLFEHSALIIQSAFRGYLVKSKFDTYLYNYNNYNSAVDILENLFNEYLKNKSNIEIEKNLLIKNLAIISKSKNIKSYKSCKTFKITNVPSSPFTESDGILIQNKFIDLYLHKEIGERFNILKQNNSNREKELEMKHKQQMDDVNNKMIKLLKENNLLKNLNQKNKINETKYKELSLENKKKENIINIITNDNQNLAKKLKIIKDKINKLEIDTPIIVNLSSTENINKTYLEEYRKSYLLFLIKKKEQIYKEYIKKYFYKYKNIVSQCNYENKLINNKKEQKLKEIIINKEYKKNNILFKCFSKLYCLTALNKKEAEFKNNIKTEKLRNLILKKEKMNKMKLKFYLKEFYTKGIISKIIEEKNKNDENNKNIKLKSLKKIINSLDNRNNMFNSIKIKNYFSKWTLLSRILSMKAVTDEKKRKKRQKQRTKRKLEKTKSANKLFFSSSISQSTNVDKNNSINTIFKEKNLTKKKEKISDKEKEKEKDKDNINYLEHTVTTDFSMAETNPEIKTDKIIKGAEKLNEIYLKMLIFYKLFGNKNNFINLTMPKENINDNKVNNKEKKEIKVENESDEDSGESSFGL